jgi:import inner membrane translocase subunit TIM16
MVLSCPGCTQKYNHLFERNEKDGTFYLVSKIYRARERLEQELGVNLEEAVQKKQQPKPGDTSA